MLTTNSVSAFTCLIRHSCRRVLKPVSASAYQFRGCSAEPLKLPTPDEEPKVYPEKILNIVSEISKLTLFEVADLNELLKKTLRISEAPVMVAGVMPGAAQEEEEEESGAVTSVQTSFTLRIMKFDQSKKVPLIKYVKTIMEGMNLVQAKKFVETLPAIVRKDAAKDEVEKLQEELVAAGAECVVD